MRKNTASLQVSVASNVALRTLCGGIATLACATFCQAGTYKVLSAGISLNEGAPFYGTTSGLQVLWGVNETSGGQGITIMGETVEWSTSGSCSYAPTWVVSWTPAAGDTTPPQNPVAYLSVDLRAGAYSAAGFAQHMGVVDGAASAQIFLGPETSTPSASAPDPFGSIPYSGFGLESDDFVVQQGTPGNNSYAGAQWVVGAYSACLENGWALQSDGSYLGTFWTNALPMNYYLGSWYLWTSGAVEFGSLGGKVKGDGKMKIIQIDNQVLDTPYS
jgi:hypothetical protein